MNRRFKNIMTAALITGVYANHIVADISRISKVEAILMMCVILIGALEAFDDLVIAFCEYRKKIKRLNKCQFTGYCKWLAGMVERQRSKGKDEAYLKNFITNFITREKRYVFSGEQIREILSLAEDRRSV